jgi:hypothetical protein
MKIKELRQLGKNGNPTFEELAAIARAEILQSDSPPKKDWTQTAAPTEPKPTPKDDWTKTADAPREFKTLPPQDKTPDRDR